MSPTYLNEEHQIFRRALKKFLEKEAIPYFELWEEEKRIPRSFWKKMGEQGFLCPWVDEKYGGANADFGYSIIINEELERVGSGLVGINNHNDIVVPYINTFGNEEQKERWLPGCISGDIITGIAMTEPGGGSDVAGIRTTAVRDGDYYILNGEKTFITTGITGDLFVVACKTDTKAEPGYKGISLIVVERDTPGFSKGRQLKKVGQYCSDTAELIFEDARVPAENLLGEEGKGFYYLMEKLQQERLLVAVGSVAQAEKMLEITIDYVKQRKAFGKSISQFQNTQFKLAEMATEIQIARTFVDDLIVNHINKKEVVTQVSMAKWWITEMTKRVATQCMQLHGGYGYMEEYEIARRFRDVQAISIYAGTNEIMKTIIAKRMGL
ncbi:acyl-CoA dehydrogenase family protein [Neobacillus niacini]|uniref:acyl-CoA dehydrogenase family protein n=1 Tax=Neobacillus niacini TaxID=86668 RepID=UPI0021CB517E|nr:acyl-CoA dehydrogenase family protein [Neobacillus niacini]MCM3766166.1 acyl-CoA dehydrogenase family protein [Neobacillus niacini]